MSCKCDKHPKHVQMSVMVSADTRNTVDTERAFGWSYSSTALVLTWPSQETQGRPVLALHCTDHKYGNSTAMFFSVRVRGETIEIWWDE